MIRPNVPTINFRISVMRPADRPRLDACDTLISLLKATCSDRLRDLSGSTTDG